MFRKMGRNRTLVLNQDYIPLSIVHWKQAMTMIYIKETAIPLKYYDRKVTGVKGKKYPIPAVVITKQYVKRKWGKAPYSKRNVMIRDKMTCQYCGEKGQLTGDKKLEIEHVIPRSRWNGKHPTIFENVVASCKTCNRHKEDRTPAEAGMKLLRRPYRPDHIEIILGMGIIEDGIPDEWWEYLNVRKS